MSIEKRAAEAAQTAAKRMPIEPGFSIECTFAGQRQRDRNTSAKEFFQPHAIYWTTAGLGKEAHTTVVYKWNLLQRSAPVNFLGMDLPRSLETVAEKIVETRLDNSLEVGVPTPPGWNSCAGLGDKFKAKAEEASAHPCMALSLLIPIALFHMFVNLATLVTVDAGDLACGKTCVFLGIPKPAKIDGDIFLQVARRP